VPAKRTPDPLQTLPGVGPRLAATLRELGYRTPAALRGEDPERMFADLCALRGTRVDRCVLYVFRCAVHAASHDAAAQDPELRKWWRWKGRGAGTRWSSPDYSRTGAAAGRRTKKTYP
jgi:hypothetical protein